MDTHKDNPDILEKLFNQLPEEELPASFRLNVMQQITSEAAKVQKRNERFGLAAVVIASLGMLGMAIALILYYIGLPETAEIQIRWPQIDTGIFSFYFYIGILALLLLFLDYRLRKLFHKGKS
ncbi:hypothetical protein [uncultured Parabacteroides sp.]|uniref:hypothetical protein n=1 Tax=uncultured Parabacteroides sp. TaxID=512312 RepID=UPI00258BDE17|nr:hypothetical protein [uncultured Parabacteroides sp.]